MQIGGRGTIVKFRAEVSCPVLGSSSQWLLNLVYFSHSICEIKWLSNPSNNQKSLFKVLRTVQLIALQPFQPKLEIFFSGFFHLMNNHTQHFNARWCIFIACQSPSTQTANNWFQMKYMLLNRLKLPGDLSEKIMQDFFFFCLTIVLNIARFYTHVI